MRFHADAQHANPHLEAVLLGTAVGDALGLPREGLSRRRAGRIFGVAPLRHALIGRRGMTSDDTEHACLTAEALIVSGGDADRFVRSLGWRMRLWVMALPPGVGMATARACLRLLIGIPPTRSGVFSAGNGPAMRAPIIGAYARHDIEMLKRLIRLSTRVTHTDPAAEHGALAIALAAAHGANAACGGFDLSAFTELLRRHLAGTPLLKSLEDTISQAVAGVGFDDYLRSIGLDRGVSGYINHTVPAAVFCWIRWHDNYREAVERVILAGGDTDTTAAITGALVAVTAGVKSLPPAWLAGVREWPRSIRWMRSLASRLESSGVGQPQRPPRLFWPCILLRNLFFLVVVLIHGVRRLLPPY